MMRHEFPSREPMHKREENVEFFATEIMDRLRGRSGFPDLAHDDILIEIRTFLLERLNRALTEDEMAVMISRLENRITDQIRSIQEECRRFEES